MISVTGYSKDGEPRVYGRGDDPVVAEDNAHKFARHYITRYPESGPFESWTFKRDACDRQVFQKVKPRC